MRDHYRYDEYGKPAPGDSKLSPDGAINLNNTFGYTGEMWDEETKLLYLRARYYEPETGRFLSRDSFGGYATDPLSLNRYTYVVNNPMNFVDPTGNLPLKLGSKNNNVQQTFDVQYWLTSLRYKVNQGELMPGGTYGQSTASAVHRFQKDHGLAHDSIVGEKTYNRLKKIIENGGVDPYPVKPTKLEKVVKNGNHNNDQGTSQNKSSNQPKKLSNAEKAYNYYVVEGGGVPPDPIGEIGRQAFSDFYDQMGLAMFLIYHGGGPLPGSRLTPSSSIITLEEETLTTGSFAGRGFTGRFTPNNLNEQLAMKQVWSNPAAGEQLKNITMNDPRWSASEGWIKMRQNVNGIEIHYTYNPISGQFDDFKFK